MEANLIALFEFELGPTSIAITAEKHYRLVAPEELTTHDLLTYRQRPQQ